MINYDPTFDPPAPTARITIRNLETEKRLTDVEMILDTGSDISLLPLASIKAIGATPLVGKKFELVAFDGRSQEYQIFRLQTIFAGKRFTGNYCVIANPIGILGRDILNEFAIVFDGPNLEWKIESDPALKSKPS